MFEQEDDIVDRLIQQLRRPVAVDPALDARVLQAITAPRPSQRGVWPWLAAAALLGAVMIWRSCSRGSGADRPDTLQCVLVAPQANSASLVGDFNDWAPTRSPTCTAVVLSAAAG